MCEAEAEALRSQFATANEGRGGRRYAPYVFTEQGVAMLSGVLRSDRAITVNIDIGARLSEHDEQLRQIFEALRQLIAPAPKARRPVGFRVREGDE
jgi:hypothetical protein